MIRKVAINKMYLKNTFLVAIFFKINHRGDVHTESMNSYVKNICKEIYLTIIKLSSTFPDCTTFFLNVNLGTLYFHNYISMLTNES